MLIALSSAFPAFGATLSEPLSFLPNLGAPLKVTTHPDLVTPSLLFGLFIGIMLAGAMYLFFIWIVIHDRGQVFLMLLLSSLAINMAVSDESMSVLLGIVATPMRDILQYYSMIFAHIFGLLFTYYFLEIDTNVPRLAPWLTGTAVLLVLLFLSASIVPATARLGLPVLGALSISIVIFSGLSALRLGVSGSASHVLAFLFFFLGSLSWPLYNLGYLETESLARNLTYAGFALASTMFAIVIAGQFATRQEEKERALQTSNERFLLAARGSNEGLFDWNLETDEVYFSDQFRRLIGASIPSNLRGLREWIRRVHPTDRKILFSALRKIRNNRTPIALGFEYRILHGSDERRWIHAKAVGAHNPHTGRVTRIVGSIGDVTQRKLSEVALKASELRFRSITEAHPVPVLITRLTDDRILYASPGAEALLGLPVSSLISHTIDRFLSRASERKEIVSAMAASEEIDLKEVILTRGDGEALPAALSARRINYQNEPAMVIGVYDLTEQKKAEEQIRQQQESLQQSEKMAALGGLLAGVAHELNNPLSVVVGQTTLLMEGAGEDKTKTRAEKIFKAADRCSRIVKSFLALARRKPPEHKDMDINAIIGNSLELLNYQFRNEDIALKLELAESLPPVTGDADQMTQVLTNLALNAAQAMHDWKGTRQITIRSELVETGHVLLSVADTGPGVPPEIKVRIFEPFFTTKSGQGGTGVGLALCLNIVEGHGGQLKISDTPGGGATFLITLPAVKTGAQSTHTEGKAAQIDNIPPMRLLLVDDEVELAQTLADLLEPQGHNIDLAANGAIALEKLTKQQPFDAIISDLRMPVMDGPELYAALGRNLPQYLKKIIYVTGDTLSPHVHAFLRDTPVPVIEKPYRLADVQEALSNLLKEQESPRNIGADESSPSPPATKQLS